MTHMNYLQRQATLSSLPIFLSLGYISEDFATAFALLLSGGPNTLTSVIMESGCSRVFVAAFASARLGSYLGEVLYDAIGETPQWQDIENWLAGDLLFPGDAGYGILPATRPDGRPWDTPVALFRPMSEKSTKSIERHEWAALNRKVKKDGAFAAYVNSSPTVASAYQQLITQFENWRLDLFQGEGESIVGRPSAPMPCTYQEWSGYIPYDTYSAPDEAGHRHPAWKPVLAACATEFRKALGRAVITFTVASNINREDSNSPGEGRNALPGGGA